MVTALYEITPAAGRDQLRESSDGVVLGRVHLRYKLPSETASREFSAAVTDRGRKFADAAEDFRFAAAAAGFALVLRQSEHRGTATFEALAEIAAASRSYDPHGHRAEFVELLRSAQRLTGRLAQRY